MKQEVCELEWMLKLSLPHRSQKAIRSKPDVFAFDSFQTAKPLNAMPNVFHTKEKEVKNE